MAKASNRNADDRSFFYRTDAKNRIIFVNQEWIDFAQENQAPELKQVNVVGQPLERFITGWETRHLYEIVYERVRQSGQDVLIPFRCDSPEFRREFQMRVSLSEKNCLDFTVRVIRITQRPPNQLLDSLVEHSSESFVICSWCKRIQMESTCWVDIEEAVKMQNLFGAAPPSLTHEVCPDCLKTIIHQIRES